MSTCIMAMGSRRSSTATLRCSRSRSTRAAATSFRWEEPWLEGFDRVVPALLRKFKPTVLVTQDGCDTHQLDPLAHLACTTRIWPHVGRVFHELAHELCDGRWVALGGGGCAVREVVPRAWTLFFADMVERPDLAEEVNDPQSVIPGAQ